MAAAQNAQDEIPYSLDSVFDDLTDKDKTVEMMGYICSMTATQTVGNGYSLMKFVTNGNKKVTCLLWGQSLIDIHVSNLIINKKMHLDGAHCKMAILKFNQEQDNFVPFELNIQASTVVNYMGMHEPEEAAAVDLQPEEVTFETINRATGLMAINGFVKMKFISMPSRFENACYGCGSITDGVYKITVNISNFVPKDDLSKGDAVSIIGNVNVPNNAMLNISCSDMNSITSSENVPAMSESDLAIGSSTVKSTSPP
ncbi:hypothetical protein TSAR_014710 (mitochondrion) [Trichomalopsis sarcophagae]|uniref:Uncharacterized protein n=1 Tax=Trichomalopsis sarcophagae TaxID=543379 RepID=A0A232EMM2_9HYME|nr:hypothetical protein TSAR_014710 [Trichomalopsis sarcophagae]